MERESVTSQWSYEVRAVIEAAEEMGMKCEPHGQHPWGWDLKQDGRLLLNGRLDEVSRYLGM